MSHRRTVCLAFGLLTIAGVSAADAAEARKFKMGQPGVAAVLGSSVPGACISGPAPQVVISAAPANGTAAVRPTKIVMQSGACKGSTAYVTFIDYKPKPGFRGTDSVSYQFSYDRSVQGVGTNFSSGTVQLIVE